MCTFMCHVTYMSTAKGQREPEWTSHVTYEWVMSHICVQRSAEEAKAEGTYVASSLEAAKAEIEAASKRSNFVTCLFNDLYVI